MGSVLTKGTLGSSVSKYLQVFLFQMEKTLKILPGGEFLLVLFTKDYEIIILILEMAK